MREDFLEKMVFMSGGKGDVCFSQKKGDDKRKVQGRGKGRPKAQGSGRWAVAAAEHVAVSTGGAGYWVFGDEGQGCGFFFSLRIMGKQRRF